MSRLGETAVPGEIIREFEDERDLDILAAIDAGEDFLDIAQRFNVPETHVQALWEALCACDNPEAGFIGPWLILPLGLAAWAALGVGAAIFLSLIDGGAGG